MAGPTRHWQGLTGPQLAACDDVAKARVGATIAAWDVNATLNSADVWIAARLHARGCGAALAWMGGLAGGVIWHRDAVPGDVGDLWMGQVIIEVAAVALHNMPLYVPAASVKADRMYLLVSAQDDPNFAIQGWAKGTELSVNQIIRKDNRAFGDARELRGLGTASIARMRTIQEIRSGGRAA